MPGHHPRAVRAAGDARSPPPRARLGAGPRPGALRGVGQRASTCALGAGAVATSTLGLDPDMTAERLGLRTARSATRSTPWATATSSRSSSPTPPSAPRTSPAWRADLARWTDEALGWAELDEAFTTGSSMMPQKRNPDIAELARGKAARVGARFGAARRRCCRASRSGITATCRRTRSRRSMRPTRWSSCCRRCGARVPPCTSTRRRCAPRARPTGSTRPTSRRRSSAPACRSDEAHRRTGALLKELGGGASFAGATWTRRSGRAFGVPNGAAMLDPDRSVAARTMPGGPSPVSVRAQADALDVSSPRKGPAA